MNTYNDIIEKLKKKLNGFGSVEAEITKRYEAARTNRTKEYESQIGAITKRRDEKIHDAAINKLKSEKDISQIHEARGLTRSGEAIGEALNREIIEAAAVRDANAEYLKSEDALKSEFDSDINELNVAKQNEISEEREKLEDKILELEIKDAQKGDSIDSDGNGGDNDGGTVDEYEPSISESVLATRLFNTFKNSDGKLTAAGSRELGLYLEKLREENKLSDDYMKNLIFALKSYGYDNGTEDEELDGTFESLERLANERSAKVEDTMYRFYRGRGAHDGEAMAEAKKHAIWAKLDVIYKNSVSREQFIYLARKMGSSMSTIYQYFDRIEDINKYNIDGGIYLLEK